MSAAERRRGYTSGRARSFDKTSLSRVLEYGEICATNAVRLEAPTCSSIDSSIEGDLRRGDAMETIFDDRALACGARRAESSVPSPSYITIRRAWSARATASTLRVACGG